jgi:hypothetical protein
MTKLFSILAVALLATTFVSCGPSAEEKAKMEERAKFISDSINKALEASMQTATEATPTETTTTESTTTTVEAPAPAAEVKK